MERMITTPQRQIRAAQPTAETLVVYQAYTADIAEPAIRTGRFAPPFKRDRMTWIKPSFLWMAYRSGWATKPNQEHVLAIEINKTGLEWALSHAVLSHYEPGTHASHEAWQTSLHRSPVRVQWDPERDLHHQPLDHRAIQIGLSGTAVARYVDDWIVEIGDATALMHQIDDLVRGGDITAATRALPDEPPLDIHRSLLAAVGA